jgi:hypothetical protein
LSHKLFLKNNISTRKICQQKTYQKFLNDFSSSNALQWNSVYISGYERYSAGSATLKCHLLSAGFCNQRFLLFFVGNTNPWRVRREIGCGRGRKWPVRWGEWGPTFHTILKNVFSPNNQFFGLLSASLVLKLYTTGATKVAYQEVVCNVVVYARKEL